MKIFVLISSVIVATVAGVLVSGYQEDIPREAVDLLYANEESKFIDINGQRVHYRDEGTGPTLVLVHGTSASLHTYDGWTGELSRDYRVVRMDLPAFGLTGPNATGIYNVQTYVDFVHNFAAAISLDTFALAGNSLGGHIAWEYAGQHTDQVSHLILIDPAGKPRKSFPLLIQLGRWPIIKDLIPTITPYWIVQNQVENVYGDKSRVKAETVDRYYNIMLRAGNRQAYIDYTGQRELDVPQESLAKIVAPTLVMWGDQDRLIPVQNAQYFGQAITNAQIVIYKGVGHVPMEEIPVKSAEDVREFIR